MGASREDDLAGVSFALDGARLFRRALARDQARGLADRLSQGLDGRPGRRIRVDPTTEALLSSDGPVGAVAAGLIGAKARPVRALLFDKTKAANWIVAWHQDRAIAVRARIEVPGFGPWSVKDGVAHVAPPIEILQAMVTLRLHLDRCDDDNAPLTVALGTHRLGRIPADEAAAVAQRRPHLCCPAEAGDV